MNCISRMLSPWSFCEAVAPAVILVYGVAGETELHKRLTVAANYSEVYRLVASLQTGAEFEQALPRILDMLTGEWLDEYSSGGGRSDIVETDVGGFSYLFDIMPGRLIAAYGVSQGRASHVRDKSRMAGHPLSAGGHYHRGHAIPHTLGGGTDINLVPQLGAINIGPFRALEREAVATPGALYFTHWRYVDGQQPTGVEQGLIIPGRADIRTHLN
jgi:hypothetical protein